MKNTFSTINPATNQVIQEYQYDSDNDVQVKLKELKHSFKLWKNLKLEQRLAVLEKIAKNLVTNQELIARTITKEMGKPIQESRAEILKTLSLFDYYKKNAERLLASREITAHYAKSEIYFQPLGVILSFMPWNFPIWQAFRFAVPAWCVGNVILQKHSDITAGVGLLIEQLVNEVADFRIIENIFIEPDRVPLLYEQEEIQAVTFTGSTQVGSLVAQQAAKNIKKTVLELGGSDPYILDKTCDLNSTLDWCVKAKLINNGQSCVAAKRFFVPQELAEDFILGFSERLSSKRIGDPLEEQIHLGPLAHRRFKIKIQKQYEELAVLQTHPLNELAEVIKINSKEIPIEGEFFSSKIIYVTDVDKNQELSFTKTFQNEEVFGPIALIYGYKSEEELIYRVNQSIYGLGAAWFGDKEKFRKEQLHNKLDVGMIAVNEMLRSDVHMPFGGVKKSGYGRELGEFGIFEFCNVQTLGWGS